MSESTNYIETILGQPEFVRLASRSRYNYLYSAINSTLPAEESSEENIQLAIARLAFIHASEGMDQLGNNGELSGAVKDRFRTAYYLLKSLDPNDLDRFYEGIEPAIGIDGVENRTAFYYWLGTLGVLSGNSIKVRLDLKGYSADPSAFDEKDWGSRVLSYCLHALILLVRKTNGMEDIRQSLEIIARLRAEQANFEEEYLGSSTTEQGENRFQFSPEEIQIIVAKQLLGIYHLAKLLTEVSEYLTTGYGYSRSLRSIIQRHSNFAKGILAPWPQYHRLAILFEHVITQIHQNSIWYQTTSLGSSIQNLCRRLAERNIIDLLPSQQEALSKNLLDAASNVTVIQMPTSAGKTLLAEFNILQTKALRDDAKVIYIVPTRALVNQVWSDLYSDFDGLDFVIEKTSKVNDLDPGEDVLLKEHIDILVSTPEKIDLLIRRKHQSVDDIALVIVDEAHNISDGERGARLELLLTILKRERPTAKFMLLSPFMENAMELTNWLAAGRNAITPIKVDWKPSDKIIAGIRERQGQFELEVIPSIHGLSLDQTDNVIPITKDFNIESKRSQKKARLREAVAKSFASEKQSILFLCRGKADADKFARQIASQVDSGLTDRRTLVAKFVEEEVGRKTVLSEILVKGIAVHHAGLTEDSRQLVEFLMRKQEISHLFATTTVAQGINFPISSVFIDDTRKGSPRKGSQGHLSSSEIMNIAGRAGRTLVDNIGKVIFPFNSEENEQKSRDYFAEETQRVVSALTHLLSSADEIIAAFSTDDRTSRGRAYESNESLAPLIQYLIHLIRLANDNEYFGELEDLFRDSFGYQELNAAERIRFIEICRTLYNDLQAKFSRGPLKFADSTGFSVPSVIAVMQESRGRPNIANPNSWEPAILFGADSQLLKEKIEVIAKMREVQLGTESDRSAFNADLVARILIGWVNGKSIDELSKIHYTFSSIDDDYKRINDFIKYLTGATFKSSWGLSALEGIVKARGDELGDESHIPSMVYFGVKSPKAISMRMLGVPRKVAENIANAVYQGSDRDYSYSQLRGALNSLSDNDWAAITPSGSRLEPEEWKEITKMLTGQSSLD